MFSRFDTITRVTDGRTDGQTDGIGVEYKRYSICIYAVERKNYGLNYLVINRSI